ncbi:unnamed protein product [Brachionus calyciflorus]|uniref:Uncharacterized protein n=1 Tax=Brachionus calyciflorus TaxID=104777 RepID=A0A813T3P8_9BILA|nr:unnamed protein product [Brachionus calyciflorus]
MHSSLRKIDKNKVNSLKKFFENLVLNKKEEIQLSESKPACSNNNNSNDSNLSFKNSNQLDSLNEDENIYVKTQIFPNSRVVYKKFKFKTDAKIKPKLSKKKSKKSDAKKSSISSKEVDENGSNKNQDELIIEQITETISVRSLSQHSMVSNLLGDNKIKDFSKIPIIYKSQESVINVNDLNDAKIEELEPELNKKSNKSFSNEDTNDNNENSQNKKRSEFSFNLFKLLKLLLTSKCYCVLLTEKQNKNDLKKLIFILNEIKQVGLTKLVHLDSYDIESSKLNDFLLADLYNLLCDVHSDIIKLYENFNRIIIGKTDMNEQTINILFQKINGIKTEQDFESEYENEIKVFENNEFITLRDFYRKEIVSPEFKSFLKCSYNYDCSSPNTKRSSFISPIIVNRANDLYRKDFQIPQYDFKIPKLSMSKNYFFSKQPIETRKLVEEPSLKTITSSNLSYVTFQSANKNFSSNNSNKKACPFSNSLNPEASFVAMLEINNDKSKFLTCENKPRNQYIAFKNDQNF